MTPDGADATSARAELEQEREQEREFLLRSLDDLESEFAVGGVDEESYRELHDDYTARAAAVIRALRDGVGSDSPATRTPTRRRWLTVGAVVVFVVLAGASLGAALGVRLPGQTSSGNASTSKNASDPSVTIRERIAKLEASVKKKPDDVPGRLLLARFLESDGDLKGALEQYDAVLELQPVNVEAESEAGRLLYLTARASVKTNASETARLVDAARARLDHAIELDPGFPDVRFYRAIVLANEYGEFELAQSDLQRYLILAPNGSFVAQARQLLADVTSVLEGTSPSSVPTTTTKPKSSKK